MHRCWAFAEIKTNEKRRKKNIQFKLVLMSTRTFQFYGINKKKIVHFKEKEQKEKKNNLNINSVYFKMHFGNTKVLE